MAFRVFRFEAEMMAFATSATLGVRAPLLTRSGLCGSRVRGITVSRNAINVIRAEQSPSVPFLPKPENLSPDMPGYAGFGMSKPN